MSAPTPDPPVNAASVELDEIRSRASAGALKLGVRNVAIRALGLVGTIILARLLKPADFGLVYETPSKVLTIPLEFEFKDVPLP